jgi:hypothetical protein
MRQMPRPATTGANLYGVFCLQSRVLNRGRGYAPGGHMLAEYEG